MRTVHFRLDANEQIGTGHAGRCLAIAAECRALSLRTVFVLADETGKAYVDRFCEADPSLAPDVVRVLHGAYESPEEEIPQLTEGVADLDVVFVDSYACGPAYLTALRAAFLEAGTEDVRIAVMDDFGEPALQADVVINYMPDARDVRYPGADLVLAGLSYAPVRKEFRIRREERYSGQAGITQGPSEGLRVLLTCGGTDPYRMTEALRSLPEFTSGKNGIRFDLIVADGSVRDMASLMCSCDFAVTAGGTTVTELCALGVPAIVFAVADNQMRQVRGLAAAGAILYAGSIGDGNEDYVTREKKAVLDNIASLVRKLLHPEERKKYADRMTALIDAKGASRIAAAL